MKFAYCLSALALGVLAEDGVGAVFDGTYLDANHPEGYRLITIDGELDPETQLRSGTCVGSDTSQTEPAYTLPAKAGKNSDGSDIIFIDFSPKGGPKDLEGFYETDGGVGIRFTDGNKWPKVSAEEFLQ